MSADAAPVQKRHPDGCSCTRCVGFARGNDVAVKHGAYAFLKLGPRVDDLTDAVRPLVPGYRASDEIAVRSLALVMCQIEAAWEALESASRAELVSLRADMRSWVNTERRLLNDLGLTPMARAKLGLDVARTVATSTLTDLHERVRLEGIVEGATVDADGEAS